MTMRRRHLLRSLAAACIPSASLLPRAARSAGGTLVLGTHLDLSGPAAVIMPSVRNGLQMRIDEANEAGGLPGGRALKLVIEDNAGQASQAVRAVEKLLRRDEVFALLSPWGSGTNVATLKRALSADVPCFAPFAASAQLRQAVGDHPLLFTTNVNYDTVTAAGVHWLLGQIKAERAGLLYEESLFGETISKGMATALAARGLSPATAVGFKPGELDLSSRMARLRAAKVDFLLCAGGTREVVGMCKEAMKQQWRVPLAASTVGRTQVVADLAGEAGHGLYGIGAWRIALAGAQTPQEKAWTDSYRGRFQLAPDDVAMMFYDHADWLLHALQQPGATTSAAALADTLRKSSHSGLSAYGIKRFVGNHATPEWLRVEQIENGRWVERSPVIDAATLKT